MGGGGAGPRKTWSACWVCCLPPRHRKLLFARPPPLPPPHPCRLRSRLYTNLRCFGERNPCLHRMPTRRQPRSDPPVRAPGACPAGSSASEIVSQLGDPPISQVTASRRGGSQRLIVPPAFPSNL